MDQPNSFPAEMPESVAPSVATTEPPVEKPVAKKSNKLLIVLAIIVPLLIVIIAVVVIAGLALYNGAKEIEKEIKDLTPTVTNTVEPSGDAGNETYPMSQLTDRLTPSFKSVPQGSALEMSGLYFAEYLNKPILFIYREGPSNPGWSFENAIYVRENENEVFQALSLNTNEQYAEFLQSLRNVHKLGVINYDPDIDSNDESYYVLSPMEITDGFLNYDGTILYVSYITEIYNSVQGKPVTGILAYDLDNNKFASFVQHDVANPLIDNMQGAYTVLAAKGDYVVASLGNCYGCTVNGITTIALNFKTKEYIVLGEVISDVYIDTEDAIVSFTEMEYIGEADTNCLEACPVYEEGDELTFDLP